MYSGKLREAVLSAKWSWSATLLEGLASLLVSQERSALSEFAPELIVPIPQSVSARFTHRFNAACLIAGVISARMNVPMDEHVLCRRRNTRPQKRAAVDQRFDNQKDTFRLRDQHLVIGRRILIVDDVLTTGATCSEAAKMLRAAGSDRCGAAVIARVLDHSA
ncbi:MAG: phosphoribosyltransferase family protein [Planctomycetaceae bacterium]